MATETRAARVSLQLEQDSNLALVMWYTVTQDGQHTATQLDRDYWRYRKCCDYSYYFASAVNTTLPHKHALVNMTANTSKCPYALL
jgi:hypothetical protein